jgi:hypothetical protein
MPAFLLTPCSTTQNPFIFRLDPELKEADLGGAAVGLSRDILASGWCFRGLCPNLTLD